MPVDYPTFLYVENDELSREVMHALLRRGLGYQKISIFESSVDFENQLKNLAFKPDIIFLDIHMEPIDGFEMLSLIRQNSEYCATPVVAVTASVMNEEVKNLREAGFDGVMAKPLNYEAFPDILEVRYTRDMEQQLDEIGENHADWKGMLRGFYSSFKKDLDTAYEGMEHARAEIQPAPHTCPQCGGATVYRFGRNGRFLSCSRYPQCKYAAPIDRSGNPVSPEYTDIACPECNSPMLLRKGRFGPFLSCSKYPECSGIVNLDKKGCISPPKIPPLLTDVSCPKCGSPLHLRRGTRGPWLSCSTFPKCSGRLSWVSLGDERKSQLETELEEHEKAHPQPAIRKRDGSPLGDSYKPQVQSINNTES